MRAVLQRVRSAAVSVAGREVSRIGPGLLVLLGVAIEDGPADASWMARKVFELRVFEDGQGRMNRSLADTAGGLLVVPQFTLLADCRKGRRPGFSAAAAPEVGKRLYETFLGEVAALSGRPAGEGVFGADMLVALENEGPVTLLLDSREKA